MLTPSQTKSIELCLQLAVLVFDAMCVSFLGLVLALRKLGAQLGKGIDDDAENDVQQHHDDHPEVEKVHRDAAVVGVLRHHVAGAAAEAHAPVQDAEEAEPEGAVVLGEESVLLRAEAEEVHHCENVHAEQQQQDRLQTSSGAKAIKSVIESTSQH